MTRKLRFLMTALLICVCGMTWADEATFNPSELEAVSASSFQRTVSDVTIACTNGLINSSQIRVYANQTLTVSIPSGSITKIVFTCTGSGTGSNGPGLFSTEEGYAYSGQTGTWEGSGNSVVFTASAQVRITKIVVTYTKSNKKIATVKIDKDELTVGETASVTTDGPAVTLSSEDEKIATVSGTIITAVGVGTTKIIARWAETEEYAEGSKEFPITVDYAIPEAPEGALFYETFSRSAGTGGRDGSYSGTIATGAVVSDQDGNWTAKENCNGGNQCTKFGSSKNVGVLTTKAIELTGEGTLTFSAAGWGSDANYLNITAEGADIDGDIAITLENGVWNNYTVNIKNVEGAVTITFSGKRGFIDDVLVVAAEVTPTTVPVTIPASGWASYCSKYDVESTGECYKCYMATKLVNGKVTVVPVEGTIKAGTGMLVKGSGSVELDVAATAPEAYADMKDNKLVGVLVDTDMTGKSCYILSDGAFYPCTGGTLAAGKAYLDIAPASAKVIDIDLNGDETAISTVNAEQQNGNIYTINGVQVKNTQLKGIYIINGKKVVK